MPLPTTSLWRHPDFLKLWTGATISNLGSQVTFLALSLTAAVYLHAAPVSIGALTASQAIPPFLVGLIAGAWVDRLPGRSVLIAADLIRAGLLVSVPCTAYFGQLRIEQLYAVSVCMGMVEPFPTVAAQAFLRTLVSRDRLLEANSKLTLGFSATLIAGPAIGGALVQVLSAPGAIVADVVSYLLSAVFLVSVRRPEVTPPRPEQRRIWTEIREGLQAIHHSAILRACMWTVAVSVLFDNLPWSAYLLYLTRRLTLSPAFIGVIFAAVGPGFLVGTLLAPPGMRRLGSGKVIAVSLLVSGIASLLVPLTHGPPLVIAPVLAAVEFIKGVAASVFIINRTSLITAITPDALLGRIASVTLVVSWGAAALGVSSGGILTTWLGLRPMLLIGAVGGLLACVIASGSPLSSLGRIPE